MSISLHLRNSSRAWRNLASALTSLAALTISSSQATARGLIIFGTSDEGASANAFEKIIDFDTGHERTTEIQGPSSVQRGYDGQLWISLNGTTNKIDMPSEVADELAEMWIGQSAWRIRGKPRELHRRISRAATSPIDLRFDRRTRHVSSATIAEDYGPVTINFSRWRSIGGQAYPFRQERIAGSDDHKIDFAQSVRKLGRVDLNLLTRPNERRAGLLESVVTVPFEAAGKSKSHIQVLATIDGSPAEFIFDTGAANILTIEAAERLHIKASGGINVGGVGEGTESGGFGLVHKVAIGGATLFDQSFMVISSPFPRSNGKPSLIAGLVGYEFLANFVTTIDYLAHTITFRRRLPIHQRGVRLPFLSDGHAIAVVARVNGEPGLFRVDTGDGGAVTLFPTYAAKRHLRSYDGPVATTGSGAGGAVMARRGKIADFILGGLDFENLAVDFSENTRGAFASRHLAGNLGAGMLGCFRITFDYPHHELWLEPQTEAPQCRSKQLSQLTNG